MTADRRRSPIGERIRRLFRRVASPTLWDDLAPIREELFGVERLEEHARSLALAQPVTPRPTRGLPLAKRLADNDVALLDVYRTLVKEVDEGGTVTPAAEWLIDNYHLVERQIRRVQSDLPSSYYRELPKLAAGPFAGYPRVFGMTWALVAHSDSQFNCEMLVHYGRAYQEVRPLTIGELWAVPITLQIVLIENLRRIGQQILSSRLERQDADDLADRLLGNDPLSVESVQDVLAEHDAQKLSDVFVVQLVHRLRDQDPRVEPALTWLDQRLTAQETTAEAIVRDVHRSQGASNVTIRNIITSLRMISEIDWSEVFERISLVDEELATGSAFKDMDFATHNLYRQAIEDLARGSERSEIEVAGEAVRAARQARASGPPDEAERLGDPGYHLFAGGRRDFEIAIGFCPPVSKWPARLIRSSGIGGYVATITIVAGLILALPLLILALGGLDRGSLCLLGLLGSIPSVDAAVALVNRLVTIWFGATLLPGLELRQGIPAALRTLVAVPTMLTTPEAIREQIERLEVHHLASPDGDLRFALLSDWADAATEHVADDETLLEAAAAGIERLNQRYGPAGDGPRFLLLHRRRIWNSGEARWIGWERKRGKLHELNRLLRGATDTTFVAIKGVMPPVPDGVRYVVTLDSDTRLPRDTIRRLVGKMAHPLNRPRFDPTVRRVVEGYAVLQPRVTPSLPVGSEGSLFQRIFSSLSGINPYASAVSDVYQDLFGEGSYAGKGIYDIDAFEAALAGRVPDSTLLSHDLFEGVFARAGLASDIEVVEEFPARYDVGALRHHRWARGDWQLLPWVLGRAPVPSDADRMFDALPAIGRWKMLDNLRRALSAPVAVLGLLAGWMMPFDAARVWTVFVLATIALPTLIPVIASIRPRRPGTTIASHLRALGCDLRLALTLTALIVVFLAHQAWLMSDAILRTLWRLFVIRRNLLQWVPMAQTSQTERLDALGFYRRMGGALVIAVSAVAVTWASGGGAWVLAAPFVALWLISPVVARWASLSPRLGGGVHVPADESRALRRVARRTWRFFERFVTSADHMLPPDNFQEDPAPVLAHRTSPTNIGLYLLSVASARDFGWIGTIEAAERLEATFATIEVMSSFRGHLFNWYDTTDLRPLDPRYVSTVDSGNLAGHLIALANTCRDWTSSVFDGARFLAGLSDAIDLTGEEVQRQRAGWRTQTVTWSQLDDALVGLAAALRLEPSDSDGLAARLPVLAFQAETLADIARALVSERDGSGGADLLFWTQACLNVIVSHRRDVELTAHSSLPARLDRLESRARSMALAMEFGFLFDNERKLLSIGYLVPEGTLDPNCYDLLASEARLASFVAIAKGDIPARHWFRLGRNVTPVGYSAALVSWSGSMFEYLMPSLVMRAPAESLLDQTSRLIVRRQIAYAETLRLPWGISESAYNARDLEFTYQYSNFGVPGLGLKRGLGENRVIAPYATALAAMVDPCDASANFARLAGAGAGGRYGFYEALDYTPVRVPEGESVSIVRAFMAHHQGMTIVAIADALFDGRMRERFHAEPIIQASELLLQERMPRDVSVVHSWAAEVKSVADAKVDETFGTWRASFAHQDTPGTLLLSNGSLSMMLTAAGSGYTRWEGLAVTRWHEDSTCDDTGSYVFIRDVQSGAVWSAGLQPTGCESDESKVVFREDRAEFIRRDGTLSTTMDVLISAESDAEIRRVSITNSGSSERELEITSYAELVLGPQAADIAHPAFSKLFVVTEFLAGAEAIIATRRRRDPAEPEIWAAHLAVVDGEAVGRVEIETDRARFLGRGHSIHAPIAVVDGRPLSNTTGAVLDPIFALRRRVRVAPGAVVRVSFWTMVAHSREILLATIDKHRDANAFTRAATLAWTQAHVQLHHLGISAGEAGLYQQLAGHVIFASPKLRPSSETIRRGACPQSALWAEGVSGDLPIVLLRIGDIESLDAARDLIKAHEYWRMKRLAVDLVILNEHKSSYAQDLQSGLERLVHISQSQRLISGKPPSGQVFVLRGDSMSPEAQGALVSMARVVITAQLGSLFDQFERRSEPRLTAHSPTRRSPADRRRAVVRVPAWHQTVRSPRDRRVQPRNPFLSSTRPDLPARQPPLELPNLEFFNGLGGFDHSGIEYVTILGPGQSTPAPWINVVANPVFGFQAATEGGGYTWSVNSRENQVTPWSNDPVADRSGEAFYLRDDETGDLWGPTALPIRDDTATYVARHGRGYCRFEHTAHGIASALLQFVPIDDPVKMSRITLTNQSGRTRNLSLTAYVEWVLGPSRSATLTTVSTWIDPDTGAMLARNPAGIDFGKRVAFADFRGRQTDWTGDRREFIGRNRTLADPQSLADAEPFSGRVGAGLDPCAALRTLVVLPPGGRIDIVFLLGEAAGLDEARTLITRYRVADPEAVLAEVTRFWDDVLGTVQVKTPDRSMDIMLNGWLLYQTIVCRLWARSGFYQASGAYGFRDQLQDGLALAAWQPEMTRQHLLRAAGRQFVEGDVQHWWLPHSGRGVRSGISDDRVWLAHAVAHYVATSGDAAVLDEMISFLDAPVLKEGEHDSFTLPLVSEQSVSLFEHCARALDHSLAVGRHGLPLIGTGDWNDGMNRVGEGGKGESVWLGWFLHQALTDFSALAEARGEAGRANTWRAHTVALQDSLEAEGWDGGWYRRGFFDDGTPLGSAVAAECRIDSIAQSWAVLSGAAQPERAARAIAAVERELIRPEEGLAVLFAPPFDKTPHDPGYVKGYPPGIRENGGQYTHAALWMVMAFGRMGEGDKAAGLFSMLNPINHARSRADLHRYKVEPYVVAADIYAVAPHIGRGGWTWYSGSASLMYRSGIESILGLRRKGSDLLLDPCIPRAWPGFDITLRHGTAHYEIRVDNPDRTGRGVVYAALDDIVIAERPLRLRLADDGVAHRLLVRLG